MHQKAAYQIRLGPARHKPLIFWKSTAVIGWPRGSQVITLTVDSVAGGGTAWRKKKKNKNNKQNVTEKPGKFSLGEAGNLFFFSPTQQPKGEQRLCWGQMKRLFEANCIFI